MQTSFKKLLSFLLVCTLVSSLLVGLVPMSVAAAGEAASYSEAPYAGVYQVTSDKAVTLTNEIDTYPTWRTMRMMDIPAN